MNNLNFTKNRELSTESHCLSPEREEQIIGSLHHQIEGLHEKIAVQDAAISKLHQWAKDPISWRQEQVDCVQDFLECSERFRSIQGWLNDREGYGLLLLACNGPCHGAIVELGSFMGRSTAFLATGSQRSKRERVVAIDHFKGSPEHQPGASHAVPEIVAHGTTLHQFVANISALGLVDQVEAIIASAEEAVTTWKRPIRLLFMDADHSYETSKRDFESWSPFIVPGGVVCFHDINQWEGVTRFYSELLASTTEYREIAIIDSIRVIQRL